MYRAIFVQENHQGYMENSKNIRFTQTFIEKGEDIWQEYAGGWDVLLTLAKLGRLAAYHRSTLNSCVASQNNQ